MAELLKKIPCPICGEPAQLMQDARHKLYVTSPLGVFKFQSNRGQDYLRQLAATFSEQASNDDGLTGIPVPKTDTEKAREVRKVFSLFKEHHHE